VDDNAESRGARGRPRSRALVAGAGVTAVALLVGAALAAWPGGRDEDSLPAPPVASAAPAPGAEAALLLDPDTVGRLRGGTWTAEPAVAADSSFVTPCGEAPVEVDPVSGAVRTLLGPASTVVRSQVLSYPDETGAIMAWKTVFLAVERCPERRDQVEGAQRLSRITPVSSLPEPGAQRAYGSVSSRECDDCPRATEHFSYGQVGRRLVLVRLAEGELESLPALAAAAEERVGCGGDCGSGAAPPQEAPTTSRSSLTDGFLPPDEAAQATDQPGWRVTAPFTADPAPLADPCREGTTPVAAKVVEAAERGLDEEREHAGSSLVQEIHRYNSATAAHEAYRAYVDRYRRCARVPDPHGSDGDTIRWELIGPQDPPYGDGELVRRTPCISGSCVPHFSTYAMVVRVEDVLSVVGYSVREDRDPIEDAGRLLAAVGDHLREVVRG
jgi:hypothetical protein